MRQWKLNLSLIEFLQPSIAHFDYSGSPGSQAERDLNPAQPTLLRSCYLKMPEVKPLVLLQTKHALYPWIADLIWTPEFHFPLQNIRVGLMPFARNGSPISANMNCRDSLEPTSSHEAHHLKRRRTSIAIRIPGSQEGLPFKGHNRLLAVSSPPTVSDRQLQWSLLMTFFALEQCNTIKLDHRFLKMSPSVPWFICCIENI